MIQTKRRKRRKQRKRKAQEPLTERQLERYKRAIKRDTEYFRYCRERLKRYKERGQCQPKPKAVEFYHNMAKAMTKHRDKLTRCDGMADKARRQKESDRRARAKRERIEREQRAEDRRLGRHQRTKWRGYWSGEPLI